tara:strand:+ start:188 stop:649 length:462 start_codon:yes stop_codon:yes gene_type:complete
MIKINVIVKNKSWFKFVKNPETYFKRKLKKIENDRFFGKKKYSFSIQLSGTKEIQFLNKKFRKINKSTDILSFPNQNKKNLEKITKLNFEIYLGDIIINLKKVNTFSKILFQKNLDVLWIHGLVHLFGFDHKKESSYKRMQTIEKRFLKSLIK